MSGAKSFKTAQLEDEISTLRTFLIEFQNCIKEAIREFENGDYDEGMESLKSMIGE